MIDFIFYSPTKVYFGRNKVRFISKELEGAEGKVLIVSGCGSVRKNGIYELVLSEVKSAGIPFAEHEGVVPNPKLSHVYKGIDICKKENISFILAVGGGSVIDEAKAIAAGAFYSGDVWDFYKKHGSPKSALPIGVVLTVAATGSEMNGNSVITNDMTFEKRSCNSDVLKPRFSILNPEFTYSVPSNITAAGVADIMAHVFENYFIPVPGADLQDSMAEAILRVCIKYGPVACSDPYNYTARGNLMWASSMALNGVVSRGKLSDWICHAVEHELSGLYDISHGEGLAVLLPNFIEVFSSVEERVKDKVIRYGINIAGIDSSLARSEIFDRAIASVREFFGLMKLPSSLSELGIGSEKFNLISENALRTRGKVRHYKQFGEKEILALLHKSL